jgi:hypothetical protein
VKLLNLPTDTALILCSIGVSLGQVVGSDKLCPVGENTNPEQFHLLIFGKTTNFDELALD